MGLGLDAQLQASRADKPVLEFGMSGYINSISARITQAKAEKTAAVNEKFVSRHGKNPQEISCLKRPKAGNVAALMKATTPRLCPILIGP